MLGRSAAVRNALEEIGMQLSSQAPRSTKRAWHLPVRVVQAMEEAVLDVKLNVFARAYAWFRLVKLWTGMRFADITGYESVEWESQGLTAVLSRIKTTAPGKKVTRWRIWVDKECWLAEETWLSSGYEIWERLSKNSGLDKRDYFLPCPDRCMEGFRNRMATYAMASKFSQALFNDLKIDFGGEKGALLVEGVGTVWTEHSERATIRVWAEAARIPEEVRKQMDRWTPIVDQVYERTGRSNVLRAQAKIAQFIKKSIGGADPFDERAVLHVVADKMRGWGYLEETVENQLGRLAAFRQGRPWMSKRIRIEEDGTVFEERVSDREFKDDDYDIPEKDDEAQETSSDEYVATPKVKELAPHGTYVLSVIGRSERKTLHRIGECHRVPGVHYVKYQVVGNDPPEAKEFHRSCRVCFPRRSQIDEGGSDESPEDDELSSSDTSTSVEDSDE